MKALWPPYSINPSIESLEYNRAHVMRVVTGSHASRLLTVPTVFNSDIYCRFTVEK